MMFDFQIRIRRSQLPWAGSVGFGFFGAASRTRWLERYRQRMRGRCCSHLDPPSETRAQPPAERLHFKAGGGHNWRIGSRTEAL